MANAPTGYSGRPLSVKLGLKPGLTCLPIKAPQHYAQLVADAVDVKISNRLHTADIVHLFCRNRAALAAGALKALARVRPGGMLWVSWPKKSSAMYVDLTEGDLRDALLPTGWVDVKVCAVDSDWSGLKFLKRRT